MSNENKFAEESPLAPPANIWSHNLNLISGFLMLATVVGFSGLVLNGPAAISSPCTAAPRASLVMMPVERIPGEGDPSGGAGGMRRAEDLAVRQPRGIADGGANLQYIETDDEPWHSTCRPTVRSTAINGKVLKDALGTALPFAAAEDALDDVICSATDEKAIDDAVKKALANGARPGCPAIDSAGKQKAAMAKAKSEGKPLPKAKSLKPAIGGMTPGFPNQGEGRKVASVHDNSV
jgi:hypothetical protein